MGIFDVVAVFNQRATAEEIVHRYPSLKLGDVYATILLCQRSSVDIVSPDAPASTY